VGHDLVRFTFPQACLFIAACLLAMPGVGLAQSTTGIGGSNKVVVAPTSADGWSGQVQCAIAVRGVGYQDDQTHTWVVSGPPIARNDFRDYPATWTVTGSGSRTPLSVRAAAAGVGDTWTYTGSDASAQVTLFMPLQTNALRIAVGQRTVKAIGGLRGTAASAPFTADVDEWRFQPIEIPGGVTQQSLSGSRAPQTRTDLVGWRQPPGATVTETCSWNLTKGGAPVDRFVGGAGAAAGRVLSVATPPGNIGAQLLIESTTPATFTTQPRLVNGGKVSLMFKVANAGASAADGTIVSLPVVSGMTFRKVECSLSKCPTVSELEKGWKLSPFPAGTTAEFTIQSDVATNANTLTVTGTIVPPSAVPDSNLSDNTATLTAPVVPLATDLEVALTPVPANRAVTSFSYDVTVKTAGVLPADGAVVLVPPIAGVKNLAVSCAVAADASRLITTGRATCPANPTVAQIEQGTIIPVLQPGRSMIFTIDAIATTSGTKTLSATARPPAGVTDSVASNNTVSASISTIGLAPPGNSDVRASAVSGVQATTRSARIDFTITVANAGPDDANFATIRIPTPGVAGLMFDGCDASANIGIPAAMCPPGATITGLASGLEIPQFPAGSGIRLRFHLLALSLPATATMSATVTVPQGGTDPNTTNNSATATASAP